MGEPQAPSHPAQAEASRGFVNEELRSSSALLTDSFPSVRSPALYLRNARRGNGEPTMADEFDNFDDEDEASPEPESKDIRNLRKKAQKVDEAERRAVSAERHLAMMRAGIDIESPTGKLFAKAYDGNADVDAIKESAAEYGLLEPPAPPVANAEVAAQQRMNNASSGGSDPIITDWSAEYAKATSPEEVLAISQKKNASYSRQ